MKWMAMLTAAVAMTAQAGQTRKEDVAVYLQNDARVPDGVLDRALERASAIFLSIDVKVDWRTGEPLASSAPAAVAVRLATDTPEREMPGGLGYALPCEGVHIVVFWDRMISARHASELLAHVMVHEIAHILEGNIHHSERGIMRAYWTEIDFVAMDAHLLHFTAGDVESIHRGLAFRNHSFANQASAGAAPGCRNDAEPSIHFAENRVRRVEGGAVK